MNMMLCNHRSLWLNLAIIHLHYSLVYDSLTSEEFCISLGPVHSGCNSDSDLAWFAEFGNAQTLIVLRLEYKQVFPDGPVLNVNVLF